jgi:hypothetical protein
VIFVISSYFGKFWCVRGVGFVFFGSDDPARKLLKSLLGIAQEDLSQKLNYNIA